ncbi:MAG: hypothetical protein KBA06_02465 [Saprospiraceae bacterium]|nr:hypothetical protein [Saprospiraceae bacterium]
MIGNKSRVISFGSNGIMGIIVSILFLIGLFYLAKFVFNILYILSPIFLIATLIINHNVVVDYGKLILNTFKSNPILAIIGIIATIIGFPIVAAYLFGKALMLRKLNQFQSQFNDNANTNYRQEDYAQYEEIESLNADEVPNNEVKIKEEKPIIITNSAKNNNKYDDFFN